MKNRNKTYAKGLLALAIGFSFAAEVANYTLNANKTSVAGEQHVTEAAQKQATQDKLSFWK
ncbi:hypothetical protein GCM10027443_08450 [Pontibacter brevis]